MGYFLLLFLFTMIYLFRMQSKPATRIHSKQPNIKIENDEPIEYKKILSAEEIEEAFWKTKINKDVFVAGYQYHEGPQIKKKIESCIDLELVRDLENKMDANAIKVMLFDHQLGFISRYDNKDIARKMDEGILFSCHKVYFDNSERKPYLKLLINVSEI